MKLRNKKTGETVDLVEGYLKDSCGGDFIEIKPVAISNKGARLYGSLAELNEEWEDYEEPKDFWYIDDFMIMCGTEGEFTTPDLASFTKKDIEKLKAIGNYFETKEEAEKAVEKLKAFKRLKDNGMIKYSFHREKRGIDLDFYTLTILAPRDKDSLDLLFGGEE